MAASRRPVSDIVRRGAVPSAIANAARRRPALFGALVSLAFAMLAALVCWVVVRVSTGLGFVAVRAAAACLVCSFTACLTVAAVCLAAMRSRSRRVASLAERLDAILRDPSCTQSFSDYEEGELAVLANELQKMTVRLRDQADELRRERDSLADSLADISHQLRTPLTSINLTLDLLGRPNVSPERRRELLRDLRSLSGHMSWLVSTLLILARADAGTLRMAHAEVRVADLVEAAAEPLRIPFELKGLRLEVGLATGGERFEGDAGWSREALSNLLKNCMEHTPAGGVVRVEAHQDALGTCIAVSDTGPGISAHDLPYIFDRFYKGEGSSPLSVGIGLALARCLVGAQGGTLAADNGPNGGARFTMSFPSQVV